jgi:glyoxylase-like metal-dependent hydrolase (beta-lactamase superfamily II)
MPEQISLDPRSRADDPIADAARDDGTREVAPDLAAIIMTHGHFDHVGVLEDLAETWQAPVYAHELERPYLDGTPPTRRPIRASAADSSRACRRCFRAAP